METKLHKERIPEEAKKRSRTSKYQEIYAQLFELSPESSLAIECVDNEELRRINSAVRQWSYRVRDEHEILFSVYVDGNTLWVEKRA
jgi:hypothetical protein